MSLTRAEEFSARLENQQNTRLFFCQLAKFFTFFIWLVHGNFHSVLGVLGCFRLEVKTEFNFRCRQKNLLFFDIHIVSIVSSVSARKLKCPSSNSSPLSRLTIYNQPYMRKKNVHIYCTWHKSLPWKELLLLIVMIIRCIFSALVFMGFYKRRHYSCEMGNLLVSISWQLPIWN